MSTPLVMRLQYDVPLGHSIDVYESLSTTNGHLMAIATKSTPSHGTAIVAHHQTAGRGQIGRSWHDETGQNLLISYLLRPQNLVLDKQYLLNLVVATAVQQLLADLGLDARIKWPNDIYIGHLKIAGLLVQCSLQGSKIQQAVVGIGLNVNQTTWPPQIPNPTSILEQTDRDYDTLDLIPQLNRHLSTQYALLESKQYDLLIDQYHDRLYLRNTWATYMVDDQTQRGRLIEIDTEGRAVIEWEDASVCRYRHGEVGFKL